MTSCVGEIGLRRGLFSNVSRLTKTTIYQPVFNIPLLVPIKWTLFQHFTKKNGNTFHQRDFRNLSASGQHLQISVLEAVYRTQFHDLSRLSRPIYPRTPQQTQTNEDRQVLFYNFVRNVPTTIIIILMLNGRNLMTGIFNSPIRTLTPRVSVQYCSR